MPSAFTSCEFCQVRTLVVRGVPVLDHGPDPLGKVAVSIDDPRRGRFLARDEEPGPLEHRHAVHDCDGMKRHAQRGRWTAAIADQHKAQRNRRGRRREPEPTGFVVPPPKLPGL